MSCLDKDDDMKLLNHRSLGFTLIEMMVVVVIVAIFAAIAIPSYQAYIRRANASQVQQEIQRIATLLERSKSRNFNYLGFTTTPNPYVIPVGSTGASIKYSINVQDGTDNTKVLTDSTVSGQAYVIRAISTDVKNYSYVFGSDGRKCKKMGTTIGYDCTGVDPW